MQPGQKHEGHSKGRSEGHQDHPEGGGHAQGRKQFKQDAHIAWWERGRQATGGDSRASAGRGICQE